MRVLSTFIVVLLTLSYDLLDNSWDEYVNSQAFEDQCDEACTRRWSCDDSSDSYVHSEVYQGKRGASSNTFIPSSVHDVSEVEKLCYYFDIRGDGQRGPNLVYRSSKDIFTPPEWGCRSMRLIEVGSHPKLSMDNLWSTIRDKVGELLEEQKILFTSIDLVRFGWDERGAEGHEIPITSAVTIWIGVQEDSTTSDVAFKCSEEILDLLKQHDIDDVEVAFRESETRFFTDQPLLAPVDNEHPLKDVIHSVTTALGLPITGEKTPHRQGTMGFYFRIGEDLYGVTTRHVFFGLDQANEEYCASVSAPKKKVILMGAKAFDDFLVSIQVEIGIVKQNIIFLNRCIKLYLGKPEMAKELATAKANLESANMKIKAIKEFFVVMKRDWSNLKSRVIGHVVWAPPITGNTPPFGYTQDVCVIQLDKDKFKPNFVENAVNLGMTIDPDNFMGMFYSIHYSYFQYPMDSCLLKLRGILTAELLHRSTTKGFDNLLVVKNGYKTATTLGCLSRFPSKVRRYGITGTFDSTEAPVLPFGENQFSSVFSDRGDSGAAVCTLDGKLVSLLTGGTGFSETTDITYTTPMHWLWNEVILVKFPGANLNFDGNF